MAGQSSLRSRTTPAGSATAGLRTLAWLRRDQADGPAHSCEELSRLSQLLGGWESLCRHRVSLTIRYDGSGTAVAAGQPWGVPGERGPAGP